MTHYRVIIICLYVNVPCPLMSSFDFSLSPFLLPSPLFLHPPTIPLFFVSSLSSLFPLSLLSLSSLSLLSLSPLSLLSPLSSLSPLSLSSLSLSSSLFWTNLIPIVQLTV